MQHTRQITVTCATAKKSTSPPINKTAKARNPKSLMALMMFVGFIISSFWTTAQAASPVLNFSDIISGPKMGLNDGLGEGAIVTVWGQNLGDTQGASKIYIDNKEAAHIYYWGKADGNMATGPAELSTYHKIQTIAFSIPATVSDGLVSIHVEVDGQLSETLPFTVRNGDIFYVKPDGNDDISVDGTWSSPWATLAYVRRYAVLPHN